MNLGSQVEEPEESRISDLGSGAAAFDDPERIGPDTPRAGTSPAPDTEALLDALAAWDESYGQGHELPINSLGISDPELLRELARRIEKQRRLYAVLRRSGTSDDVTSDSGDALPSFPGHVRREPFPARSWVRPVTWARSRPKGTPKTSGQPLISMRSVPSSTSA